MTVEVEDHLAHYGVPGMKWGKGKVAAAKQQNTTIRTARAKQNVRKAELNQLTAKRLSARTQRGKQHIDAKIADKKFELANHNDARVAAQRTTGEKFMKGARVAGMLGLAVVGLNTAANVVSSEIFKAENEGGGERITREFIARTDAH